jgi:hypothetical protein
MTLRAILAGSLAKAPVEKVGKSGKAFALVSVRETGVEPARWWNCIVFGDAAGEVLKLSAGEPVALVGSVEGEIYTPSGGEARVSWRFVADAALTARRPPRREGGER